MPRFEEVLTLGRKLVDELGREPRVDTLARWMAHYVAELIDTAVNARGKGREAARQRCFETIVALWDHRAALPNGRRPFEKIEPVMRAIESLDLATEAPRYFTSARRAMEAGDGAAAEQTVLDFVSEVDETARILIAEAVVEATGDALDESRELMAMVKAAEMDAGAAGIVVSFVSKESRYEGQSRPTDDGRAELVRRIDRLDRFVKLATGVSDALRERLDALPSDRSGSGAGVGGGRPDDD